MKNLLSFVFFSFFFFSCGTQNKEKEAYDLKKNLNYSSMGLERLEGDLYIPRGAGPFPAILSVHGGGWTRRDRGDMREISEHLAKKGFVVFNINYRLAPENRWPLPFYDVKEAVRFMRKNAPQFQIDSSRIAALGYSAGAHLVLMLANTTGLEKFEGPTKWKDIDSSIQVVAAGSAPTDLSYFGDNKSTHALFNGHYQEKPELYKEASPIHYIKKGGTPSFLYHGKNDWIVEEKHSLDYVSRLKENGVPHRYKSLLFGHVANFLWGKEEIDEAADFFLKHF